jgi:zinc-ribbon domain
MFCDRCGNQVNDNVQFCTACGKPLAPSPLRARAAPASDGRVGRHIKILASLWLIYAILRFMEMAWIFLIGRTFLPSFIQGIVSDTGSFPSYFPLGRLISGGLMFAGFWAGTFAVVELVAAWGLFEHRPWARILTLVIAFLALLRFPFGTALGIYTLWVLLPGPAAQEYERLAGSHAHGRLPA